jgi:aminobenzoyl-glutamate utilization protein B
MDYAEYLKNLDSRAGIFCGLSDGIWEKAEVSYTEVESARILSGYFEGEGFLVTHGAYGIPTAFTAQYGSGSPRIGLLGEFDALSGMSQEADVFEKKTGAQVNGHGCGHNLLGTGALAAASAVKEFLAGTGKRGTVIYYGCPAEENGSGKAFMARAGAFKDLDAALTWHPGTLNRISTESSLANILVKFYFHGMSSHAAAAPELGRSALDAVELMNVGTNYLREHMIDEARIHYAVTNSGGMSPNVVQAEANAAYMIRAPEMSQVQDLYKRVIKIAEGAALMTGTSMDYRVIKTCSNLISNRVLEGVLQESFEALALPDFTGADREYAARFSATCPQEPGPILKSVADKYPSRSGGIFLKGHLEDTLYNFIVPYEGERQDKTGKASTDVGDVSWLCPTAQFTAATWAPATPAHSWQAVAQGKGRIAHAMTLYAGKVLARSAMRLLSEEGLLNQAKAEFTREMRGRAYFPVPDEAKPEAMTVF